MSENKQPLPEELNDLLLERLEATPFATKLLVHSKRKAYLYGQENEVEASIPIEQFLLEVLCETGPVTRGQLVKFTNLPRTTLYDVLTKLVMAGKVTKRAVRARKRGRPKVLFRATKSGEESIARRD